MPDYLFVYGTLQPELAPPPLRSRLARLRRIGAGSVPGRLYDLGRYPGAVFDAAVNQSVSGEVFELSDASLLRKLDAYEGFDAADPGGSLYVREQRAVLLADGRRLTCWVYAYNRDPSDRPLIPHGDYRRWREETR
jgi:gamma-glutamylcyclotransferase (GGCT)/AIG2-like uncharacterized protein YtfP